LGLERGPLSLMSTTEELLWRKYSDSGLEIREYGLRDPSRWPRGTFYPQKLTLTSPTSGGRSVGIVRLRTQATEFSFRDIGSSQPIAIEEVTCITFAGNLYETSSVSWDLDDRSEADNPNNVLWFHDKMARVSFNSCSSHSACKLVNSQMEGNAVQIKILLRSRYEVRPLVYRWTKFCFHRSISGIKLSH
jgi:hypothetical protein